MPKRRIGEILVRQGALTPDQLERALAIQREEKLMLGEVLTRMGVVRQVDVGKALAEQLGVPFVALEDQQVDAQAAILLPEMFCRAHQLVAFRVNGSALAVAMVAPDDLWAVSEVRLITGYEIEPYVASPTGVRRALDQCFDRKVTTRQTIIDMRLEELRRGGQSRSSDLLAADAIDASDVPVVRLVNSILSGGISSGSSDIHFEPQHPEMRIRYRIDGVLYDNMVIPRHIEAPLVSRIKVMADLDITERRHPQDGHITFVHEAKPYDLRVSTMPNVSGEKVVIRVLEKDVEQFRLDRLGLSKAQQAVVDHFLSHPYGMILVTGPTGSGKSTSLYAMLNKLNQPETNIITLEDPVENQIPGMNQIGVDPNYGMSFASGLKYILRQDPDIVMVGEIRDGETAEIAVQAALTGHLLMSTLHTNDAAGAVTRLIHLGVQPFLVASSLVGIVAQRLLRRVCPNCAKASHPPAHVLDEFGSHAERMRDREFSAGEGCDQCFGTGYRGRCGVFEIMPISQEIAALVERRVSVKELRKRAVAEGMQTLVQAAIERALACETTLAEVRQRVLVWEQSEQPVTPV